MDEVADEDDENVGMALEEAPDAFTMEEVESDNDPEPMDEMTMDKLRKLHEPRESRNRIGVASACMQQFALLSKIDPKRLKENPSNDFDCCAHECVHCNTCINIPWKSNKKACEHPIEGGESCYANYAQLHPMREQLNWLQDPVIQKKIN